MLKLRVSTLLGMFLLGSAGFELAVAQLMDPEQLPSVTLSDTGYIPAAPDADLSYIPEQQGQGMDLGYYPTEQSTTDDLQRHRLMSTLADDGPYDGPWPGEESRFHRGYDRTMNAILTPMVPNEAVWTEPLGTGMMRENVRLGIPFAVSNRRTRLLGAAGPFGVDVVSVSAFALHTRLTGPGASRFPDDGFLAGLALTGGLYVAVTDEAYLRVHATFYYLPTEGKGGFYFGNGGPTVAQFRYETAVGDWQFELEDRFAVFHPLSELLDEIEVDELAVVGRRRFGRSDLGDYRAFSDEDVHFLNSIRGTATKWIAPRLKLRLHADHWDLWKTMDFDHFRTIDRLGAAVFYDSDYTWILPWAGYDFYNIDEGKIVAHRANVGATLPFTRTFQGYVRGGWLWMDTENGRNYERPTWDAGFVHHITSDLSHSLFGGYDFAITDFGDPLVASYWRYTMRYSPHQRWSIAGYVQQHRRDFSDWNATTYGLRFQNALSTFTRLRLAAAWSDRETDAYEDTLFLVRASISHDLTRSLTAELLFQLTDRDSDRELQEYRESLLMLMLTWRL